MTLRTILDRDQILSKLVYANLPAAITIHTHAQKKCNQTETLGKWTHVWYFTAFVVVIVFALLGYKTT